MLAKLFLTSFQADRQASLLLYFPPQAGTKRPVLVFSTTSFLPPFILLTMYTFSSFIACLERERVEKIDILHKCYTASDMTLERVRIILSKADGV